jgi:probable HAF family extracellular repeat protein
MGRERRGLRWAVAVMCLWMGTAGARSVEGWTLVDLGTLGGPGSYGAAISDNGSVAGCADVDAVTAHAFIYRDGAMRDLGPGCALAVNDRGTVAGRAGDGELVVWLENDIAHLGVHGYIGGINNANVVVGSYAQGTGTRAFRFINGAVDTLMDDPASSANAINARGEIAGTSSAGAFVFRDGAINMLGTLGGSRSDAKGINDASEVVGLATDEHGQPLSFLFDGGMKALQAPGYSGATAINNRGQIVGNAEGSGGYFLDAGIYARLDTLPPVVAQHWRKLTPTGINNQGWIVGTGTNPAGDLRAFLLIPGITPEKMKPARASITGVATASRTRAP